MPTLPLAVGIADAILAASRAQNGFDVYSKAEELIRDFPADDVSHEDVADALREEAASIGLCAEAYC